MIEVKEFNLETRVGLATDAEEPRCKDLKAKDGNVIVALDIIIIVPSGSIKEVKPDGGTHASDAGTETPVPTTK